MFYVSSKSKCQGSKFLEKGVTTKIDFRERSVRLYMLIGTSESCHGKGSVLEENKWREGRWLGTKYRRETNYRLRTVPNRGL